MRRDEHGGTGSTEPGRLGARLTTALLVLVLGAGGCAAPGSDGSAATDDKASRLALPDTGSSADSASPSTPPPSAPSTSPTPTATATIAASPTPGADQSAEPEPVDVTPASTEAPQDAQPTPGVETPATPIDVSGSALAAARELEVKGRAPRTGYDRAQFGQTWADVDHNGCDTRNDILRRDLIDVVIKDGTNGCTVLSGTLNDPYSGESLPFERGQGTSSVVQIDHVVALSDAWQKGAQRLSAATREIFANDPLNLWATQGRLNQQKGDGDTATWLPPSRGFRCEYVARQVAVKRLYGLWVTAAEQEAMVRVLTDCPDQPLPDGGYVVVGSLEPVAGVAASRIAPTEPGSLFDLDAADPTPAAPAEPALPAEPAAPAPAEPAAPLVGDPLDPRHQIPAGGEPGCPVKGNHSSSGEWIYHVPTGQHYDKTEPEECFDTPAQAEAAGYRASKR